VISRKSVGGVAWVGRPMDLVVGRTGVSCFNLIQAPSDIEWEDATGDASSHYTGEAWRQKKMVCLRACGVGIDSHMTRSGLPTGQWNRFRRCLRLERLSNRAPSSHQNRLACSFVVMIWVHYALHGDLFDSPAFILHYRRLVTSCLQAGPRCPRQAWPLPYNRKIRSCHNSRG
jgi:hypothetical protein